MGRSTPDWPRGVRPEPPPAPPRPTMQHPDYPNGIAPWPRRRRARCSYCGRGGDELTQCEGCGATVPEASAPGARPTFPPNRTIRGAAVVPEFPLVKR